MLNKQKNPLQLLCVLSSQIAGNLKQGTQNIPLGLLTVLL